ncbi:T9SS type A sorting domain-containing protein, partial [Rhodocaloribacter sp.]
THRFRLKQVDFDGSFAYSPEVEVEIALPEAFVLGEAYPNPFNPVTRLSLSVRETERVEVSVYDVTGRRVGLLHQGPVKAGQTRELVFDGSRLGSGLYFIRARGESFEATRQVVLVK